MTFPEDLPPYSPKVMETACAPEMRAAIERDNTAELATLLATSGPVDDDALRLASSVGSSGCVELLLQSKASVDAVGSEGYVPLHYASREGHA